MSGKAKSARILGGISSIFNAARRKISRQDVYYDLISGYLRSIEHKSQFQADKKALNARRGEDYDGSVVKLR